MRKVMVGMAVAVLSQLCLASVEVHTVDGRVLQGELSALDTDGQVEVKTKDGVVRLPADDVVRIRFPGRALSPQDHRSPFLRFELADGGLFFGTIIDSDYDVVRAETRAFGAVTVDIDRLQRIVVLANTAGLPRGLGANTQASEDLLFVRSRDGVDHVVGSVSRFASDAVFFEWKDDEESRFDLVKDGVVAVRISEPEVSDPIATTHAVVHCRDGSRIAGKLSRSAAGALAVSTASGAEVNVNESEIVEIALDSGRFVRVAALEPTEVAEVPFLEGGLTYGLHRNAGLDGAPIQVGGTYYPEALSVHSKCSVRYRLGGAYARFSASVGVDDRIAERPMRGAVAFSVHADGKVIAGPTVARAGDAAIALGDIDVTGVQELVLVADFADNFHFNGWAVWGAPLLVRAQ